MANMFVVGSEAKHESIYQSYLYIFFMCVCSVLQRSSVKFPSEFSSFFFFFSLKMCVSSESCLSLRCRIQQYAPLDK